MTSSSLSEPAGRMVPPLWRLVVNKTNPITPLNQVDAGPSFYCVHPIAGDVSNFHSIAERLQNSVRFYGLQVTRDNMNAEFAYSIEKMADYYSVAIMRHQPEGPIYLGGWSAGAIVALEMAHQLQRAGRTVPLLVAFDGAPCNTGTAISRWDLTSAIRIVVNIPIWIIDEMKQAGGLREFLVNIRIRLMFRRTFNNEQTLDGDAVERLVVGKSLSMAQMCFIKAFYEALRVYVPQSYDGDVLVIESRTQPLLYLRQIGAAWKKINPFAEIVRLKSNHEGILREPFLSVLTKHVRDHISGEFGSFGLVTHCGVSSRAAAGSQLLDITQ